MKNGVIPERMLWAQTDRARERLFEPFGFFIEKNEMRKLDSRIGGTFVHLGDSRKDMMILMMDRRHAMC